LEYPTIITNYYYRTSAVIGPKKEKVGSCRMLRRAPSVIKLHYMREVEEFVKGEDTLLISMEHLQEDMRAAQIFYGI